MKNFKVGLQLFSVRGGLARDVEGTLKAVKDMGYDYLEFAGYYDMEASELKKILDKYGLVAISTHDTYEKVLENPEKKKEDMKTLGVKYYAQPWMGLEKHKGSEDYEQVVSDYKKVGTILNENGIKFLYHNHSHEFTRVDNKFVFEWIVEDVGEELLLPEIDVCWVHYAGYKPEDYILKYKNQLPILHLKDFVCENIDGAVYTDEISDTPKYPDMEAVGFKGVPVGHGVQDVPAILKAAEEAGTEYIIVEDEVKGMDCLEAVKLSREYLKSLGI